MIRIYDQYFYIILFSITRTHLWVKYTFYKMRSEGPVSTQRAINNTACPERVMVICM